VPSVRVKPRHAILPSTIPGMGSSESRYPGQYRPPAFHTRIWAKMSLRRSQHDQRTEYAAHELLIPDSIFVRQTAESHAQSRELGPHKIGTTFQSTDDYGPAMLMTPIG